MSPVIRNHLDFLYGESITANLAQRLQAVLDQSRARLASLPNARQRSLTSADSILITYADQVQQAGELPLKTLADFAAQHLREVVSGIHILPFYPWSSDDGFAVKDFFFVDPELGSWNDVERLRTNFDLMFDAVFNHMSAGSEWFSKFLAGDPEFRDFFVTVDGNPDLCDVVRPRALPLLTEFQTAHGPKKVWTTFSADQVDLNFRNPEVLLAAIRALLFYVERGARFIRLDAIAYLWKCVGTTCIHLPQTHRFIQLLRAILDEVAPGVQLITETNVPHLDNISYFGDGTNEAQLVYNFSLPPLTLHTMQTGDATALTAWAQSLRLPGERVTWFNFLASHDGIGVNPVRGILSDQQISDLIKRVQQHGGLVSYKNMPDGSQVPYELNINFLDALSNPAAGESHEFAAKKFLNAQSIMLSLQGVPGIYFHSLFGSRGDPAGVAASGINRRINREKLMRSALEQEMSQATTLRARVFAGYCELLRIRKAHAAFDPTAPQQVLDLDPKIFAVLRESRDASERILCLHNVSNSIVHCPVNKGTGASSGISLLSPETEQVGFESLSLEPYEVRWLKF